MSDEDDMDNPAAVVSAGSFRRRLPPGTSLLVGRAKGNDLQFGHSPENRRVPRTAGRLECRDDGVLIHNLSDKLPLRVAPFPGPVYDVPPLTVRGTHPHPLVKVTLSTPAAEYTILIDTRGLRAATWTPASSIGNPTEGFHRVDMHPRHRRFLIALCLPLLTAAGERAKVPSYEEIAKILARYGYQASPKTVRNNLDRLREWLTNERGVPDLVATDDERRAATPMVDRLAYWAIRSGNVTDADLDRLEQGPEGPDGTDEDDVGVGP